MGHGGGGGSGGGPWGSMDSLNSEPEGRWVVGHGGLWMVGMGVDRWFEELEITEW